MLHSRFKWSIYPVLLSNHIVLNPACFSVDNRNDDVSTTQPLWSAIDGAF